MAHPVLSKPHIRVKTVITTDGITPAFDNEGRKRTTERRFPISAKKAFERENAKLPNQLKHVIEDMPGESMQQPAQRPAPAAPPATQKVITSDQMVNAAGSANVEQTRTVNADINANNTTGAATTETGGNAPESATGSINANSATGSGNLDAYRAELLSLSKPDLQERYTATTGNKPGSLSKPELADGIIEFETK